MIAVQQISRIEELSSYRHTWNECTAQTPGVSFFHTLEWLQTYWQHFGDEQKLRVLVVTSAGKPIGILPLCIHRRRYRFGKVRVLGFPLDECGAWNGPIGENREPTLLAVMQFLRNAKRDWDLLELRSTDPAPGEHCRVAHSMQAVGLSPSEPQMDEMSVIDFDGTWEGFIASKPKKIRHEI